MNTSKLLWLFTVFFALFVTRGYADLESLPLNWYTLPEDRTYEENRAAVDDYDLRIGPNPDKAIDRLFRINLEAFERMEEKMGPQAEARKGKWSLAACIFDLGISGSGNLGMLVAKGDATGAVYWRKAAAASAETREEEESTYDGNEDVDADFSAADSRSAVEAKLEPVIQAVMATGEVKNEAVLRKSLSDGIWDYHTIVQNLPASPEAAWQLNRLRLDFQVDISGKVNPVTTVGGGVRLRFEWDPSARASVASTGLTDENRKIGENLKKLIENLGKELQQVPYDSLQVTKFDLTSIKFGLGIFGDGNVGVVKVGANLFGYVYFAKVKNPSFSLLPQKSEPVPVVDYTSNAWYRQWAQANQVPFKQYSQRGSQAIVYSVAGDKLRQGLIKAVKMGTHLVEIGSKHRKKWELYQVKTEYALSLSGTVALLKLGGTASIELVYQRVAN